MKLCLVMIVKNSQDTIREMLRSWKNVISSYCICDTGSTDLTMDYIREELQDMSGILFEEPFVNFSVSRNRALEEAETHFPEHMYAMMDDSCILERSTSFLPFLRTHPAPCYQLRLRNKTISWVSTRILSAGMRYKYRVHEMVDTKETPLLIPMCRVRDMEHPVRSNARIEQDLKWLEEDELEYNERERSLFFRGMVLGFAGKTDEALACFEERITLGRVKSDAGLFQSHMIRAASVKESSAEQLERYTAMALEFPMQREPLFYQAVLYQRDQQHGSAIQALEKAMKVPLTDQTIYLDAYESYLPQMLARYYYELDMKSQCLNVIRSFYQYGDPFHIEWEGYKRRLLNICPRTPYEQHVVSFHPTDTTATYTEATIDDYYKCISNYTIENLVVYHKPDRIPYFPNIKHVYWIVDDSDGHNTFPVTGIVCRDQEHIDQLKKTLTPMYHDAVITMERFHEIVRVPTRAE